MEPASLVQILPYRKEPRRGQVEVINAALTRQHGSLNCQLPTGYGKTFTAFAVYAGLREAGVVDRLLYVVPSVPQLEQLTAGAGEDFADVCLSGPSGIVDVGYSSTLAIKAHRNNSAQIFACTIQALTATKTWENVVVMIADSRWMIVFDEYHHYSYDENTVWGKKALALKCVFRLAMSATPYRKQRDGAFGEPEIRVSYRQALKEGAVKRLVCHSYVYRIDAVLPDGQIKTYTTEQLAQEAGSNSPDAIEKMLLDRSMRWSPKYVSPLVGTPITRMSRERLDTGLPQQVLIGTMCCSHAKLVCEQVKAMFPELRIDWVGTGSNGRTPEENKAVLRKFCPAKKEGERRPEDVELDVLVHVGMAGEGLDSVFVTEVVHLNPANINNTNNQENGRAARVMPGVLKSAQTGRINVDSSSPYAAFSGEAVMDVMDDMDAVPGPSEPGDDDPTERMLPEEPRIRIFDMECIRIDDGEVERMKAAYAHAANWPVECLDDPDHPLHARAEDLYRAFRAREAAAFNVKSVYQQWHNSVEQARTAIVAKVIRRMHADGTRYPSSLAGDIKRRINAQAKLFFGSANGDASVETLQQHYKWMVSVEAGIVKNGLPSWLL